MRTAHWRGTRQRYAAAAHAPSPPDAPPTVWHHGGRAYSCDEINQIVVTDEEDNVLQAFLQRAIAMDTGDLVDQSGVTNAARVMGQLRAKYGGRFAGAIRTPGGVRDAGGYYIRVRHVG